MLPKGYHFTAKMRRRICVALRMVVALGLWLQYAFLLARVGMLALPTKQSYSWQEVRTWALNPDAFTPTKDQQLNLRFAFPRAALLSLGVVARLLSSRILALTTWGILGCASSAGPTIAYVWKKGCEPIREEYGFRPPGVVALHPLVYLPWYGFTVLITEMLLWSN